MLTNIIDLQNVKEIKRYFVGGYNTKLKIYKQI